MSWCFSCFTKTYEAPEVLELDYRHSTLTEVPAEVFSFERTLEKLHLGSNQISDLPPSLFHCHGLKELDLCDNDLTTVPAAIGSLTKLWRLDISRNAISEISDSIKNCKSLTQLDLSLNHLVKLPEGVSQLVNLEELFLNDTYLEFLHANFGRLTKLKVLELRENSIQTLPKSMSRLTHLQRLDVGQNDLFEFPEVVGTMTALTELWCDNNNIRSLSKVIGSLSKLNCLDASSNEIREIADEISKCTQLVDVTLAMNNLESLPDTFPKLESLSVLRLDSNSIQYLPEDFGNLKSLQELSLIRNLLKALPPSFGLLRKLHTLYLDDNLLPDLPKEIGSCTALTVLSVSKNRLTGIPSEFGHLCSLKVLTLAGNQIVNLPVSILNIPHLMALWLSESQTKPLLQLNQEIDPRTGQRVLTCFLLPQMPYTNPELTNGNALGNDSMEGPANPPRRSRPSIKFVTDAEPAVIENNVKRGLLRAPTPYPKELRALAKHASNLRQSRENGDVLNTDEPEYEGDDYNEDDDMETDRAAGLGREAQRTSLIGGNESNANRFSASGSAYVPSKFGPSRESFEPQRPNSNLSSGLPDLDRQSFDYEVPGTRTSYSSSSNLKQVPQVPAPLPVEAILSKIEESNKRSAEMGSSLGAPYSLTEVMLPDSGVDTSSYGSSASELARKSPPPYHVAARRAAFFRSSGASIPPPSSPRLASLPPTPAQPSALYIPTAVSSLKHSKNDGDSQDESTPTTPLLNRTYVIESNDAKETSTTMLETEEMLEGLGLTSKVVETKSESETSSSRVIDRGLEKEKWLREKSVIESIVKSAAEVGNSVETTTTTSNVISETLTTVTDLVETENLGVGEKERPPPEAPPLQPYTRSSYASYPSSILSSMPIPKTTTVSSAASTDINSKIPVFATKPRLSPVERLPPTAPPTPQNLGNSNSQCPPYIVKDVKPTGPPIAPKPASLSRPTETGPKVNNAMVNTTATTNMSRIPKIPSHFAGSNLNNLNNKAATTDELKNTNLNLSNKPAAEPAGMNNNNSGIAKPLASRLITPSKIPSMSDPRILPPLPSPAAAKEPLRFQYGLKPNAPVQATIVTQSINTNVSTSVATTKIPKFGEAEPVNSKLVKRTLSGGSKIPMKKFPTPAVPVGDHEDTLSNYSQEGAESELTGLASQNHQGSGDGSDSQLNSNMAGRKPWIFGTHKNARVVNLEHTKVNGVGFTVCNGFPQNSGNDGQGMYIETVDRADSTVKVGDKILQVDGIDVTLMTLDIVLKIIGNCQETFTLLVSRQN